MVSWLCLHPSHAYVEHRWSASTLSVTCRNCQGSEAAPGPRSSSFGDALPWFFFGSTGVCTLGLHLEPFHQSFSVMGVFEIRFHKLFACAGFEPQSS
jgi:hypothetical protein